MSLKSLFTHKNNKNLPDPLSAQFQTEFELGAVICPNSLAEPYKKDIEFLIYDYNGAIHTLLFTNTTDPLLYATYAIDSITTKKDGQLSVLLLLREIEK